MEASKVSEQTSDKVVPEQSDDLDNLIDRMKISVEDPRAKLRSWLGKILKIVISDNRIIVGTFICTDREGNAILENSLEYAQIVGGKLAPKLYSKCHYGILEFERFANI